MRNENIHLRNHLFAQLERLEDESLDEDQLKLERERTSAIVNVAKQIVDMEKAAIAKEKNQVANKKITLEAMKLLQKNGSYMNKDEVRRELMSGEAASD